MNKSAFFNRKTVPSIICSRDRAIATRACTCWVFSCYKKCVFLVKFFFLLNRNTSWMGNAFSMFFTLSSEASTEALWDDRHKMLIRLIALHGDFFPFTFACHRGADKIKSTKHKSFECCFTFCRKLRWQFYMVNYSLFRECSCSDVTFYVWVLSLCCRCPLFTHVYRDVERFSHFSSSFLHFYDILIFTKHVYIL